jgi:caffeoyl-CoA O-methyltransferase
MSENDAPSRPRHRGPGPEMRPSRELEGAIAQLFAPEDEALRQTGIRAEREGLPPISVSALQGRLLQVLAAAAQARRILEIGALAGYSGTWLARALPAGGRLISLEIDEKHAAVVRESFRLAGVEDRAEVRVGPALQTLPTLAAEGPFDLVFIDADKDGYPDYLDWAIRLSRPGTVIVADNCVMGGSGVKSPDDEDGQHRGARRYNAMASADPNLTSVALPIGSGMTVSVVRGPASAS